MLQLYSWPTPNGHKIHIMLEECGLKYEVIPVNIGAGDQFKPDFLKISPNNKMPAIVDTDGPDGKPISLFESGAILIYLAAKTVIIMHFFAFAQSSVPMVQTLNHYAGFIVNLRFVIISYSSI